MNNYKWDNCWEYKTSQRNQIQQREGEDMETRKHLGAMCEVSQGLKETPRSPFVGSIGVSLSLLYFFLSLFIHHSPSPFSQHSRRIALHTARLRQKTNSASPVKLTGARGSSGTWE